MIHQAYILKGVSFALIFAVLLSCDKSSEPAKKTTQASSGATPTTLPGSYRVVYDLQGKGDTIGAATVQDDGTAPLPATPPAAAGHAFVGWYATAKDFSDADNRFDFSGKLTADITLYAKWVDAKDYKMSGDTLHRMPASATVEIPYTVDSRVVTAVRGAANTIADLGPLARGIVPARDKTINIFGGNGIFGNGKDETVTHIIFPETVTHIGGVAAFANCAKLTTVSFPSGSGLKLIGGYAFYLCDLLEAISLPATVETVASYAFFQCSVLSNVELSDELVEIGAGAFGGLTVLSSIIIPGKVQRLAASAFAFSSLSNGIEFKGVEPPIVSGGAFSAGQEAPGIFVPTASVSKYRQAKGFASFGAYIQGI